MDSTALFAKTPPVKLFFIASVPGAVSMLASSLYQFLDGIFVGNFLDATAFAALNLAMPFVIINFSLADLVGVGSSVPISIALGREDRKEANNIFTCACILIVVTGAAIGAVLFAAGIKMYWFLGGGAVVFDAETGPVAERRPESHEKYLDVQFLAKGEEALGFTPYDKSYEVAERIEERDLIFEMVDFFITRGY